MKRLVLALLTLSVTALGEQDIKTLKYYYIPFQIETYEPITVENIKNKASQKGTVSGSDATELLELLAHNKGAATFDKKRVRLLVEIQASKTTLLADASGTVDDGRSEYALDPRAFAALKRILAKLGSSK